MIKIAKKPAFKSGKVNTGLLGVATPREASSIKNGLRGGVVGTIYPPSRYNEMKWTVSLMVKNDKENDSCPFKWISFLKKFETETEARTWVTERWDLLNNKYEIYEMVD